MDQGYLAEQQWRDARPFYYLEVKTTVGACATPFFVSRNQYDRVRRHCIDGLYAILTDAA